MAKQDSRPPASLIYRPMQDAFQLQRAILPAGEENSFFSH